MDPSSVILASGFFLVSSVSLLLVNCRNSSAEKRQETSPSRKSVPVGSPSPTNGTSTSSNGKITQQESHRKKKKSAFKSKKKKSQPRHSIPITVPPPRSFPPLPVIKRTNEHKRNLKTAVPNTTSLKTILPRDSDDEIVSDNKERETPAPSEHDETDTKLDFDVENTPSPVVLQNTEKVAEEVSEVVVEDDESDEVVEKEDSTEVSASISSQSDIDEPTPPSTTPTPSPPTPKNARKRKRRRRNRSTASTKVIQQSTKTPTSAGAQSDSQPQRTNHNRDHNQSHNHGGQIGTKISVTPAFDLDESGRSCKSPLSLLVQTNTLMPDIGVHVEILKQPGKSQPNESSRNDVNPSPTRPPIKSKSHGSKLYALDHTHNDALSNLETKPLFIAKDKHDLLSPPPAKSRAKPTKKPIVPVFRASTAPSTFSPSPYTDTDNDSNTSGFESKTIHDSETSTRRRTPSAFKNDLTRDTLGTPPISLEDEAFQQLDRESVMSTSMSRTTATSVSDLEFDPTPKHDDDWAENDGLEQQAELNRKRGIFPLAVPSEPSESPQPQVTNDDDRHQNRRRSKQKRSKHKQKKKSKSKSMPVTTTHTRISSETQTQATSVSPTIEKEPQMMMPQQFGQHLAHLQHVPRQSSQPDTSMVNISLLPQQSMGQVPMVAGRIPGPSMVPYPGAIDSNGVPQAPMYPAMNAIPPTFIPPTMIQPATLASQSYTDLTALAAHQAYMGLQGMGPLVRTQSAPTLLDTSAMFPNMYYQQQPLLQQQLLQMQAQMPGQLPAQIPTPIPPPMPISVPSSTPLSAQDERSESSDQSHGKSKINRSKSDNSSLFLVQHPSGELTFQNPQTYNPTDASAQRLSSGSPAATPSIANSATSDARSSSASQPIYQMPQIMPQMQHPLPMFSSPYYGSPYFNMQNQMLLSQQQQMMQIQTVPTGTTPNIDPNIRTFHENVLSAPLYQPTHQPTHVPSTTTNGTEVSVSGVPNPLLQQNLTSSNTDGS